MAKLISGIYSNPVEIAKAKASREWQQKLAAKKLARKKAKPQKKKRVEKLWRDPVKKTDRPEYRPGMGKEFYDTRAWINLRYKVLHVRGTKCECCGAMRSDGIRIHVDHVRPRHRFPQLELVESNLQVLCEPCNIGKGARYETDWRSDAAITQPCLKATGS